MVLAVGLVGLFPGVFPWVSADEPLPSDPARADPTPASAVPEPRRDPELARDGDWCATHERRPAAEPALVGPAGRRLLVLLHPEADEPAIKVTALVVTLLTFALTLAALRAYLGLPSGPGRVASLAERAAHNTLTARVDRAGRPVAQTCRDDLVVRHAWIPSSTSSITSGSTASA